MNFNDLAVFLRSPTRRVGTSDAERHAAFWGLIHPDEVSSLFQALTPEQARLATMLGRTPATDIAGWLRTQLQTKQLQYLPDPATADVWQSSWRTLQRKGGDCEDLTILIVSMLLYANISAYPVGGELHGEGHAWVEGTDAHGGFMIEATSGDIYRRMRPYFYTALVAFTKDGIVQL